MKITDMKVFQTAGGHANWTFVKLYTDEGVTGVGESSLERRDVEVKGELEGLRPRLIGQDPTQIELIWNTLHRCTFWSGGPVTMSALSGIEQALWDIKGKPAGMPVYQLLGGKCRKTAALYAPPPAGTPRKWRTMSTATWSSAIAMSALRSPSPATSPTEPARRPARLRDRGLRPHNAPLVRAPAE